MDNIYNRYKYLAHEISENYSINISIAKEYLVQMIECYITLNPDSTFEIFFNLTTDIVLTLI